MKLKLHFLLFALGLSITLACARNVVAAEAKDPASGSVRLNQLGYLPGAQKLAVLPDSPGGAFSVIDTKTDAVVYTSEQGPAGKWVPSGESVRVVDFSSVTTPGEYFLRAAGLADSDPFRINSNAYVELDAAALKAFYFNRASTALLPAHAGVYARAAGHPDDKVLVHASAASATRPEGTPLSAPKGWYDAGDYNKYIVNSGISTYTLLAAYEHFPDYFRRHDIGIPESGNAVPDILDEVMWNLAWMLDMQDPADGGVYHKLTNKQFDGMSVMPVEAGTPRYVVQKSTAAALDFAAVMATASRVYGPYESRFPGLPARMRDAAVAAWQWAQSHPDAVYAQPDDIKTGGYDDKQLQDEFFWAATELYLATGDMKYYSAIAPHLGKASVPNWSDVAGLPWVSLAQHRDRLQAADRSRVESGLQELAGQLTRQSNASAYRVALQAEDLVWGSNAVALNQAMMLIQAYRVRRDRSYLEAAQSLFDYVLGRNALATSFVTGYGARSPMHIHHRPSVADGIEAPVPGWLSGGPNPRQQDKKGCPVSYPSNLPAKSWLDHQCSYASNEIAINWNAPLVYVAAALPELTLAPVE